MGEVIPVSFEFARGRVSDAMLPHLQARNFTPKTIHEPGELPEIGFGKILYDSQGVPVPPVTRADMIDCFASILIESSLADTPETDDGNGIQQRLYEAGLPLEDYEIEMAHARAYEQIELM